MAISRKIERELHRFFESNEKKALLVTGARQVGKTFIIRELGKQHGSFAEINFYENRSARSLFEHAGDSADLLTRLSAVVDVPLIPGRTLIFFDEVQECKEIVTPRRQLSICAQRFASGGGFKGHPLRSGRVHGCVGNVSFGF